MLTTAPRETDIPVVTALRRVWIVNHHAGAPDDASGTRHHELAKRLIAHGHDVTIFAANFADYPGRRNRLRRWSMAHAERHEGVRFVWLWTLPYVGNAWRRPLNMLSFVATLPRRRRRASRRRTW